MKKKSKKDVIINIFNISDNKVTVDGNTFRSIFLLVILVALVILGCNPEYVLFFILYILQES